LAAPEGKEPFGKLGAELRCLLRLIEDFAVLGNCEPRLQYLEIAGNHGEKIVEVVGNATCKLADGFHLLRLTELLLHFDARSGPE
jgi:hypothetical protein